MHRMVALGFAIALAAACSNSNSPSGGPVMSFFVTSQRNPTGTIGGLCGADAMCSSLAAAAGVSGKTWHAYLSVERDASNGGRATNARDRVGSGPWINSKLVLVANNVTELHAMKGNSTLFVDEKGNPINGQWIGSPSPVEHDIMTGSAADGTLLPGLICADWTSDSAVLQTQVGHSDGFGANRDTSGSNSSWNSAHLNGSCSNTAPRGGAGRIYCFAVN
jgi:hypothetical protein